MNWQNGAVTNAALISDPSTVPGGFNLDRKLWVCLNRLRSGHGKNNQCRARWGQISSAVCDCGYAEQSMNHIVENCPLRRFSGPFIELSDASTQQAIDWLSNLDLQL